MYNLLMEIFIEFDENGDEIERALLILEPTKLTTRIP